MLQPASLDVVYPGLWLDDGVYATHGHYLDRHVTVPSFERLGAGVLGRLLRAPADSAASPDDYEVALAPMYALLDAIAARVGDGRAAAPGQRVGRAPGSACRPTGRARRCARPPARRRLPGRHRARSTRPGIGPLKADLSGVELRRASLRAMGEVVARLGIDARHVDLRPHPPRGPAARRRRRRVAAGRRRAAHQHRLLGLRVDVPRPRLGQPVLARRRGRARERRRAALHAAARGRRRRRAQAAGSTTPGVKQVA